VPGQQRRTVDLGKQAGGVGGISGHTAQRIGRSDDAVTLLPQPLDDPVSTGRIGEGAVHQHDRRPDMGVLAPLVYRIHRGTSCRWIGRLVIGWRWSAR